MADLYRKDPCTSCGFEVYRNATKRPKETLLCTLCYRRKRPSNESGDSRLPITHLRANRLAKRPRERINSWHAAKERAAADRAANPPDKEQEMTDISHEPALAEPDLGVIDSEEIDATDDELSDEEWEESAGASPESDEIDDDENAEAEAEAEVEQPSAQPVTDDDEADELEDEPVEEEPVEEKPKAKAKAKSRGKGKAKAKAEKPKRARTSNARERGALMMDVLSVVKAFDKGEIKLDEGQTLTPHRIAQLIKDRDGLDEAPSTGAVTNNVRKLEEIGFALTYDSPFAFKRISAKGSKEGYESLDTKHREKKAAERAKAREAKK